MWSTVVNPPGPSCRNKILTWTQFLLYLPLLHLYRSNLFSKFSKSMFVIRLILRRWFHRTQFSPKNKETNTTCTVWVQIILPDVKGQVPENRVRSWELFHDRVNYTVLETQSISHSRQASSVGRNGDSPLFDEGWSGDSKTMERVSLSELLTECLDQKVLPSTSGDSYKRRVSCLRSGCPRQGWKGPSRYPRTFPRTVLSVVETTTLISFCESRVLLPSRSSLRRQFKVTVRDYG